MSDLLEPFRRAGELGCLDFSISENGNVYFASTEYERDDYSSYPLPYTGPIKSKVLRINRYAAAVCECWWRDAISDGRAFLEDGHMITLCREFGRKHGGQ